MQWTFFLPLFLASSSLLVFWLIYRLVLAQLTHFNWQRGYLLFSVLFSCSFPFLPRFSNWLPTFLGNHSFSGTSLKESLPLNTITESMTTLEPTGVMTSTIDMMAILGGALAIIYLTGFMLKLLFFVDKLSVIRQLIISNPKEKVGEEWLVKLSTKGTAFSFFHYLFLTQTLETLKQEEVAQVIAHEQIHSQQKHSLDIILVELAEIFLWFHPVIYRLKNSLKDLHEYLVDETMTQKKVAKKTYAELLLKLTNPLTVNSLTTGFNHKQIGRRITMLSTTPSASYHKLKFLLMIPIITSLLLFSACFGDNNQVIPEIETKQNIETTTENKNEATLKIGKITWEGNTIFSEKELNEAFKLKEGDTFDKELLDKRLYWDGEGKDVSSLYINKGYAYFKIEVDMMKDGNHLITDKFPEGNHVIDFNFKLFEGVEVSIANINISGNKTIETTELLEKIDIKKGEPFNRSKIIAAQKSLIAMGKFDPEKIGVSTLILEENNQRMNIEFSVVEIEK